MSLFTLLLVLVKVVFFIQKFKHLANVLSFTVTVSSIIRPPFFSLEKAFEVVSFLKLILEGKVKLD